VVILARVCGKITFATAELFVMGHPSCRRQCWPSICSGRTNDFMKTSAYYQPAPDLHAAGNWVVRPSALTYAAALCTALLTFTTDTMAQTSPATLTTLATFQGAPPNLDGIDPLGVVVGSGGVLYGVTQSGGSTNNGTVFSLTPPNSTSGSWIEARLYNFTGGTDGGSPTGVVIGNGGVLYGTTGYIGSGSASSGTVFSLTPPASGPSGIGPWTERVVYSFTGGSGGTSNPANLTIGAGGVLYGTSAGGTANSGAVFSLTPPTSPSGVWTEAVLYNFPAPSANTGVGGPSALAIGSGPSGHPVLYGATRYGGTAGTVPLCNFPPGGCGTVFSLTPPASPGGAWTAATLYSFTGGNDGAYPTGVQIGSGGVLYGVASNGGPASTGVVFALTPQSASGGAWTESVLYAGGSTADLAIGPGGVLYAVIESNPISESFTVVSLAPPTMPGGAWTANTLYSFTASSGSSLAIGPGGALFGTAANGGGVGAGMVYSVTPPAGSGGQWTGKTIYAFTGGPAPNDTVSGLAIGSGGVLYGVTSGGGTGSCPGGCGTIFSLTPPASTGGSWTENVLYMFAGGNDGAYPLASVAIGAGGVLYGTTSSGGESGGTVFSLTPPASPGGAWTESVLHSFSVPSTPCTQYPCPGGPDGNLPTTSVTIGSGGVLYGTTNSGGTGYCDSGCGTAFQLTPPASPGGGWTELNYSFVNLNGGITPFPLAVAPSSLAIGSGGVLYGTTQYTGSYLSFSFSPCGTVFSLTPPASPGGAWTETVLYNFSGSDGCYPVGGVVIGNDGVLYGGVSGSGISLEGTPEQGPGIFSLTPPTTPGGAWTEAVLHIFGGSDGSSPNGLMIGSGGVLYGTSQSGGSRQCGPNGFPGCGVVFELVPPPTSGDAWLEATLYNFTGGADGAFPQTGVVIGTGGVLYGTTQPSVNTATVFSLQPGSRLLPTINAGGVVNAASFTAPVAPGSIASAFGDFLISLPLAAAQSPLPSEISGLSLQFGGGTQAPLFFASGTQVNFQVPWELSGQSVTLTATVDGQTGAAQTIPFAPFAPAIFTINAQGSGPGAILDASYQLVNSSNPATAGSVISIFCTGLGQVTNQPPTGSPAPLSPLAWSGTPTVTIGGVPANVSFSGLAPGYVGLYQVNAEVPTGLAANDAVPVVLQMGGSTSNAATIAVQ
jgi:uncharacterized protein (TIGR03437 family)